ncbi:IclR family transcriptional regulator [Geodermatophilus sabuli]|uniref:IclR family transcriptional regulator n=1 Tax=Geodermatophilus sabuli TaxID=1564158 RepID=A0A7K3VUZ1_9ACTN|nr:IclR family transcriptional regulator [Geodermatophilus sabuli]
MTARALSLLGAFTPDRASLSCSDLARRTRLPLSTVHRLAGDLVTWGALERDADGRLRIGLHLWEVTSLVPHALQLRESALPFLADLSLATQENALLAVPEGPDVVLTEWVAGRAAVPVTLRVGGRMPVHATSAGLVLLAHAPVGVQDQVLGGPLPRLTDRTITAPDRLRRVLADIRCRGHAVSDRMVHPDSLSVAAPVVDAGGRVVAALSLVVRAGSTDAAAVAPLVLAAARGAGRELRRCGDGSRSVRPSAPGLTTG